VAKSDIAILVDQILTADDRTLGVIEYRDIPKVVRSDLLQRARQAIAVRRLQLAKVRSYELDSADADYLRSVIVKDYSAGHPHCYVHCQSFDNAMMRGKYIIACDGYRLHCIKAPDKELGSYAIWENTIYAMHPDDVGKLPDYAGFMKYTDLTFMSKARLEVSRNLDDRVFFIGEKKGFPMITVSAGYDKVVKASSSDEGHSLPHTLMYRYLQDARTDQDCTMLFGYDDRDPVYAVDRRLRIAVISPINIKRGRLLADRGNNIAAAMGREERLSRIAAAFYDWRSNGFSIENIREYIMGLEFSKIDWSGRPGANREMRFFTKNEIKEIHADITYGRWEPPQFEAAQATADLIDEDKLDDGLWDIHKHMRRDLVPA
jgi:hypothetical protein